jgi:glycine betaine/proline transport system substrate-binding protein
VIRAAAVLALLLTAILAPARAAGPEPVRIGWMTWADGVFVTRLVERLIETELEQPVERVRAGIAEQYQGLAGGRLDLTLMSWQPRTHAPYLRRVRHRVEDLGAIYDGGRLGWAVPAYVPEESVATIADLRDPAVRERFAGRIVGIDPASGLMRLSRRAVQQYQLADYALEPGSGPAMGEALSAAIDAGDWIVVTAWSPHWIFAAHELRYLRDERGVLGGTERIHAVARRGFYAEHPAIGRLLSRFWLPRAELEHALLAAQRTSVEAAVSGYLADHPGRVAYWVGREP